MRWAAGGPGLPAHAPEGGESLVSPRETKRLVTPKEVGVRGR